MHDSRPRFQGISLFQYQAGNMSFLRLIVLQLFFWPSHMVTIWWYIRERYFQLSVEQNTSHFRRCLLYVFFFLLLITFGDLPVTTLSGTFQ